jgi:predicted TIM-barrel fold metal-dependent hydrolase
MVGFIDDKTLEMYDGVLEKPMVWDAHCHIGTDMDGHKLTGSQLIRLLDANNVDKAIIFPFNDPLGRRSFKRSNDVVLRVYRKHRQRFIPFFRLNPNAAWEKEFDRRISQGFMGVKLHPRAQGFKISSEEAMRVYEAIENSGLPLLLHTGFGVDKLADDMKTVLKQFPGLRVVLGHSAFVDLGDTLKVVKRKKNIYFDTSVLNLYDLYHVIKGVPHERIVYGSDAPYGDMELAFETLLGISASLKVPPRSLKNILGENLRRLLPGR